MIFTKTPFPLIFAFKELVYDDSDHLYTLIYSFRSTETKQRYILRAEYHKADVFAIKFYLKNHSLSKSRYSITANLGHTSRIYLTCASIVPLLLKKYPDASFGLIGSRSYDRKLRKVEPAKNNRRFNIYSELILQKFGEVTFAHYDYSDISGYLLVNKNKDVLKAKKEIEEVLLKNYHDIHTVEE